MTKQNKKTSITPTADSLSSNLSPDEFFAKLNSPVAGATNSKPASVTAKTPSAVAGPLPPVQVAPPPVQVGPPPVAVGPEPVGVKPNLPAYSVSSPLPVVGRSEGPAPSGQLPAYWGGGKNMASVMDAAAAKNKQDWKSVAGVVANPIIAAAGAIKGAVSEAMKPAAVSVAPQKMTAEEYEAAKKRAPGLYK